MTVNEYQQQALTTAIYRKQIMGRFNLEPDFNAKERDLTNLLCKDYVVSGFCGEVGEFLENPSIGELGGVLWYCAAIATEYDEPLSDVLGLSQDATFDLVEPTINIERDSQDPLIDAAIVALKMQNQWKKKLRDGKEFSPLGAVSTVIGYIVASADTGEIDVPVFLLSEAAKYNLEQLAKRAQEGKIQGDGNNR